MAFPLSGWLRGTLDGLNNLRKGFFENSWALDVSFVVFFYSFLDTSETLRLHFIFFLDFAFADNVDK